MSIILPPLSPYHYPVGYSGNNWRYQRDMDYNVGYKVITITTDFSVVVDFLRWRIWWRFTDSSPVDKPSQRKFQMLGESIRKRAIVWETRRKQSSLLYDPLSTLGSLNSISRLALSLSFLSLWRRATISPLVLAPILCPSHPIKLAEATPIHPHCNPQQPSVLCHGSPRATSRPSPRRPQLGRYIS